jgi:site-specific recombinase XerD
MSLSATHARAPGHTPDLFDGGRVVSTQAYESAFDSWLQDRQGAAQLREGSSMAVYRAMWRAWAAWAAAQGVALDDLVEPDLLAYLACRGGSGELSHRYAWRFLRLVQAVMTHRAQAQGLQPNPAAGELLQSRPQWRFANAAAKTPLPEHLSGAQARQLVAWLLHPGAPGQGSAAQQAGVREGPDGGAGRDWQHLRNRTAVALQLGAGLTPADVRALQADGVQRASTAAAAWPQAVRIPGHGACPAREAPVARWAARLLSLWLDTRAGLKLAGPLLLPAARDGRPWSKVAQYTAARRVLQEAGLPRAAGGSFLLRHTFAIRQLQRGAAQQDVARWLGLADTTPLQRYRLLVADGDAVG